MKRTIMLATGLALAAGGIGLNTARAEASVTTHDPSLWERATGGATAERWTQPYGGCKEAYQAPRSDGADECRQHGWTIRRHLVVNPHAVVRFSELPHCREEDGSGQHRACTWNYGEPVDGNGKGLVYWVDVKDRIHYVWPERPLGEPTPRDLADALAEGMVDEDWNTCFLDEPRTHVRCPDGFITRVWGQR